MSYIEFHNPGLKGSLEISGAERFAMKIILENFFIAFCDPRDNGKKLFAKIPKEYIKAYFNNGIDRDFEQNFALFVRTHHPGTRFVGHETTLLSMICNTAYRFGSDTIKLMARLHGQCEIHCYFDNKAAPFIGEVISEGLSSGLYRKSMGWNQLKDYCKEFKSDEYPHTVCSYSVTNSFPSIYGTDYEENEEEWDEMSEKMQWEIAIKKLLNNKSLSIDLETWNTYTFDTGETVIDLLR